MISSSKRIRRGLHGMPLTGLALATLLCSVLPPAALAQQSSAVAAPAPAAGGAPQETVTEELIRLLVQHNALSPADAESLIKKLQAQQQAPAAQPVQTAQPGQAAAPAVTTTPAQPEGKKGDVRVIYIPESEKQKIREQVKQEVLATAKAENWAQPNALPEWVNRISFNGDFRFRQEFDFFDSGNSSSFVNYQAVNNGAPFDTNLGVTNFSLPPVLNTTQNRELPRFRARLGLNAAIADDLSVSFRFASGNTTNPVSTNQTLGTDFNKTSFNIDRAFLEYRPLQGLKLWAGRMPNPWLSTELVWDEDLNFDGVAGKYQREVAPGLSPFFTFGAFSVENTAFDLPTNQQSKASSRDKWLFAGQIGADWKLRSDLGLKAGLAYYHYYHIQGKFSSPCNHPTVSTDACDTDNSRFLYAQKGNTVFLLRNPTGLQQTDPIYQYFGLSSPFHILNFTGRLDWVVHGPIHAVFNADYVNNLAFSHSTVYRRGAGPVNNFGPEKTDSQGNTIAGTALYQGGNAGYLGEILVGYPVIVQRWDWNVLTGYRHLESDAVLDAFADSDFHLGGTNAKGYYIGGSLGFTHNAWITARYLSADEVSGPPLSIDVVQLDLNARF